MSCYFNKIAITLRWKYLIFCLQLKSFQSSCFCTSFSLLDNLMYKSFKLLRQANTKDKEDLKKITYLMIKGEDLIYLNSTVIYILLYKHLKWLKTTYASYSNICFVRKILSVIFNLNLVIEADFERLFDYCFNNTDYYFGIQLYINGEIDTLPTPSRSLATCVEDDVLFKNHDVDKYFTIQGRGWLSGTWL